MNGRARASSRLGWVAAAGVVLGVAGLAFGLGALLRSTGPTTPSASSARAPLEPVSTVEITPSERSAAPFVASVTAPPPLAPPSASGSAGPEKKAVAPRPPAPTSHRHAAKACTQGGDECQRLEECIDGACTCSGAYCNGICVDTSQNPRHCGACDRACSADETCTGGACVACPGPFVGVCNNACVNFNAWETCGGCRSCGMSERCDEFHCVPK